MLATFRNELGFWTPSATSGITVADPKGPVRASCGASSRMPVRTQSPSPPARHSSRATQLHRPEFLTCATRRVGGQAHQRMNLITGLLLAYYRLCPKIRGTFDISFEWDHRFIRILFSNTPTEELRDILAGDDQESVTCNIYS